MDGVRRNKRLGGISFILLSLSLLLVRPFSISAAEENDFVYVIQVTDDYTLKLEDGRVVRLIGIDIPRSNSALIHSFQKFSSSFLKNLVEGKKIRLEFDSHKSDKTERLLVYAYLEDGTFVNEKIIREGYAQVLSNIANKRHLELFLKSQDIAREEKKGLWHILSYVTSQTDFANKIDMAFTKDGVYSGKDTTPLGAVEVEVTLKDRIIKKIKIIKNSFTHCESIDKAFTIIPERIISRQSPDVDAVTGATVSSTSIKYSVLDALKKAE